MLPLLRALLLRTATPGEVVDSYVLNGRTYRLADLEGYGWNDYFPVPMIPDFLAEMARAQSFLGLAAVDAPLGSTPVAVGGVWEARDHERETETIALTQMLD